MADREQHIDADLIDEYIAPLDESPVEFVEDVDTKSIRVAVVRPELPPAVPAPRFEEPLAIPRRPNVFRRIGRALSW